MDLVEEEEGVEVVVVDLTLTLMDLIDVDEGEGVEDQDEVETGAAVVRSILGVELGRKIFSGRAAKKAAAAAARSEVGNVVSRNAENLERAAREGAKKDKIIETQAARIKTLTKVGRLSGREINNCS